MTIPVMIPTRLIYVADLCLWWNRPLNKLTKEANPPLIPYLGVVIQNVLALQEFPDRVEGDLINFKKVRCAALHISPTVMY